MTTFLQSPFWAVSRWRVLPHWTQVLVTAPVLPVLTLDEVKRQIRVDVADEDALLQGYLDTATQQVEQETGLKLLTQTWDLTASGFSGSALDLPFGPIQSVTHIKYTDTASVLQTVLSTDYLVDVSSPIGRIGLTDSASWPSDLRAFQPITIRVVAGWATVEQVPLPLKHAIALLVGWMMRDREPLPVEWMGYDRLVGSFVTRLVA